MVCHIKKMTVFDPIITINSAVTKKKSVNSSETSTAKFLKTLFAFIHESKTATDFSVNTQDFSRERKLSFATIAISILHLFKESVEHKVLSFLPLLGLPIVSGAAFSYARYKIKLSLFLALNAKLSLYHKALPAKLWNGYSLIAGDGTTISLPPSPQIKEHFGVYDSLASGSSVTCLAQSFLFYDILTNFIVDAVIAPICLGESTLMLPLLKELCPNSLIILDRGYGYFSTIKELVNSKKQFCIRISSSQSQFSKTVLQNKMDDYITFWTPTDSEKATARRHGLGCDAIQVRVTKIILASGELEILVSSLFDFSMITKEEMSILYFKRWGIEENIKKLKPKMKLEQFGCKLPKGVYQEFYAHIFMMNLVAVLGNEVAPEIETKTTNRKHKYKFNWQNAFRFTREKFIEIFWYGNIEEALNDIFTKMKKSLIAIIKNRAFERAFKKKKKTRANQCYK
jgi:Transposase DDE domain